MYQPAHFRLDDQAAIATLVARRPLATLVNLSPQGLDANHIPMLFEAESDPDRQPLMQGRLHGHLARANPLWRQLQEAPEVLVIFGGADGYISPNWYASKQRDHRVVPTWSYEVVHMHGRARVIDDVTGMRALVAGLSDHFEASMPRPWAVADAPDDYIERLLGAIVGLEIMVTRIEGKSKVGQDKPLENRASLHAALVAQQGERAPGYAELAARLAGFGSGTD